jgi:hypothetical protein
MLSVHHAKRHNKTGHVSIVGNAGQIALSLTNYIKRPTMTQSQALTQALILALTAPNDAKSKQASDLAEQIAYGLTKKQVENCKKAALKAWETV